MTGETSPAEIIDFGEAGKTGAFNRSATSPKFSTTALSASNPH